MRRSISILSPDYCGNALGRAYILAKLLQEDFDVHIVAFGEGRDVWAPVRNDATIEYRRFFCRTAPGLFIDRRRIIRRFIDGDLILSVKPLASSFGMGICARRLLGRPLLLDIDDWELGFLSDSLYWELRLQRFDWLFASRSPLYTRILDRFTRMADAISVSNGFLQRRYGGTWVPHARDESLFEGKGPSAGRAATGCDGKTVLFLGSARLNKGLDVLLSAWSHVSDPDARLRIIGTPRESQLIRPLTVLADSRTSFEWHGAFE
jgi:hypothetical protein